MWWIVAAIGGAYIVVGGLLLLGLCRVASDADERVGEW